MQSPSPSSKRGNSQSPVAVRERPTTTAGGPSAPKRHKSDAMRLDVVVPRRNTPTACPPLIAAMGGFAPRALTADEKCLYPDDPRVACGVVKLRVFGFPGVEPNPSVGPDVRPFPLTWWGRFSGHDSLLQARNISATPDAVDPVEAANRDGLRDSEWDPTRAAYVDRRRKTATRLASGPVKPGSGSFTNPDLRVARVVSHAERGSVREAAERDADAPTLFLRWNDDVDGFDANPVGVLFEGAAAFAELRMDAAARSQSRVSSSTVAALNHELQAVFDFAEMFRHVYAVASTRAAFLARFAAGLPGMAVTAAPRDLVVVPAPDNDVDSDADTIVDSETPSCDTEDE